LAVPTGIRALFSIFAFLAMFCHCAYAATTWTVTNANDSGAGSLRQAMTDAQTDDGTIVFDSSLAGFTITLASELPAITQSLTIEGNGITISGNNACRIMYIQAQGRVITIRRVHFKDGVAGGSRGGGAIRKDGSTLNLQSCIFSGNSANQRYSDGGALHNGVGALNVQGCTFYNNSSLGRGGAIYQDGSTVTLTGNIFYGNTASSGGDVIYRNSSSVTSGGYNVYDGASTYFSFNADNNTLPDIFNFNATLQHYDLSANSRRPGGGQTARPAFFACGLSDG
jgi:predicted outer membrane repeat protein